MVVTYIIVTQLCNIEKVIKDSVSDAVHTRVEVHRISLEMCGVMILNP